MVLVLHQLPNQLVAGDALEVVVVVITGTTFELVSSTLLLLCERQLKKKDASVWFGIEMAITASTNSPFNDIYVRPVGSEKFLYWQFSVLVKRSFLLRLHTDVNIQIRNFVDVWRGKNPIGRMHHLHCSQKSHRYH